MPRSAMSRAALLLVLVLFAVPALQAAPHRADAGAAPSAPATSVWDLFTQVWDFLTGVWSTNGCEFDPDGRCQPKPATVEIDNGCEFDPSGRCGN